MTDPLDMGGGPNSCDAGPGQKILCLHCNTCIQSLYRHDFKWCPCKSISIDGGKVYTKISHQPHAQWTWVDSEEDINNATLVGPRDTKDDMTWCHNCEQLVLVSTTEERLTEIQALGEDDDHTWLEERDFCKLECKKREGDDKSKTNL